MHVKMKESWVEEIKGEKNLVAVHGYEEKDYEIPVKEIHHVQLPPKEVIHHNHTFEPNRQTIHRVAYEVTDHNQQPPFREEGVIVEKQVLEKVEVPQIVEEPIYVNSYQIELDPQPVYINIHFHPCTSLTCPESTVDPAAPFSIISQPLSHYTPAPHHTPLVVKGVPPSDVR